MQKQALSILAEAHDGQSYCQKLEEARGVLERYLERLESGMVAVEDLVISKRLTRPPRDYQKASLTAVAAQQLFGRGVQLRPGQTVEYVITDAASALPNDRVRAYALWEGWHGYDRKKYRDLLLDAFHALESPFRHFKSRKNLPDPFEELLCSRGLEPASPFDNQRGVNRE